MGARKISKIRFPAEGEIRKGGREGGREGQTDRGRGKWLREWEEGWTGGKDVIGERRKTIHSERWCPLQQLFSAVGGIIL